MALFSKKIQVAVNAAFFIAYNATRDNPVTARYITDVYDLSDRAVEPALQKLVTRDLVQSIKGPNGGYYIARPEEVTLAAILACFVDEIFPIARVFL